ncbi:MAG TPA: TSUP family transporter [Deltaproteobacteria bacterium]|nr:TSUP family transporter [Deltaproteobacteria bacterium]HIJ39644.1 TSUP family transporter [Deltaproteobacteria bacterium]
MKPIIFLLGGVLVLVCGGRVSAVNGPPLQQFQEDINGAVASVRQSVVTVTARKKSTSATGETLWYESIGSGFFVDDRGFILTNYHVVEEAKEITVTLWRSGRNEFQAQVAHADQALDLSLLKIDAMETFPVVEFGNSDTIETGDWAISIGSPFGFEHTVSLGIISDLHRDLRIERLTYKDMIQTDAVINEGNSGGPLVNILGKVIGVGTAIYAPDGTYTGLGFAIPINSAKHFFTRITGAVRVALAAPTGQTGNKEPINLNKRMPNDALHRTFSDCTTCHTITTKMTVSLKAKMNHEMVGACDTCHIFVNDKVATGPVTVANTTLAMPPAGADQLAGLYTNIILKLAMITLVISIVFTMMGVGGGFLYVPILLSCGLGFHTAVTTSLVMLTAAQISGLYIFFRSGLVDVNMAVRLGVPTMVGAFVGGMVSEHFNVNFLVILFAATMFFAAYIMIQDQTQLEGAGKSLPRSPWVWQRDFMGYAYCFDMMVATPLTFGIGFLGGLLGLAGGWLNIPLMVILFGVPMKIAIATSSLMVPATGFAGLLGHSVLGHFEIKLALSLSLITIIGAQIGSRISVKTDSNLLRFIFAFVMSLVGLWMILMVL